MVNNSSMFDRLMSMRHFLDGFSHQLDGHCGNGLRAHVSVLIAKLAFYLL